MEIFVNLFWDIVYMIFWNFILGEVLFVLAGCLYRVENLIKSVVIFVNFVDLLNWDNVLEEFELNVFVDFRF